MNAAVGPHGNGHLVQSASVPTFRTEDAPHLGRDFTTSRTFQDPPVRKCRKGSIFTKLKINQTFRTLPEFLPTIAYLFQT